MSRDEPPSTIHHEVLERISDGVIALDSEFRYTYLNDEAAAVLDVDPEAVIDTACFPTLSDAAEQNLRPALERAGETAAPQTCEWADGDVEQLYLARVYPDERGYTVVLADTSERTAARETLGRLHEATRRMLLAETPAAVAELVSRAGGQILGLPVNAVHLYDDETDSLTPVALSEACRDVVNPAPELDSGLAWEAYQSGSVAVYPDVRAEANVYNTETPFRSELLVPMGEHGVFIVAAEAADAFCETDVTLATLLGANAAVALDQVTSERRLAQQRDNLELLTRMMSHDIRNDLQVVGAVAELLGEQVEGPQREFVEKIRRNTAAAVELTTSAQELVEAMLRTEADPTPVGLRPELETQLDRVRETSTDVRVTVDESIPTVRVLADSMLGSVFRNLLKNAVQHNDADSPEVAVEVAVTDDTVRIRIADNGPGIPDERKESIFGRGERGMSSDGTGIGLYLVQTLVRQYGGQVWVEDRADSGAADGSDRRGAVFVVELERA